jgi:hypothetical protein
VLAVYKGGFASTDRLGRLAHRITWEQVSRLSYQGRAQLTHDGLGPLVRPHEDEYRLETHDATPLVLVLRYPVRADLGHEMSSVLLEGAAGAKLPAALTAIDGGETLQFGSVKVDRQGLGYRRFHAEWSDIGDVRIHVRARRDIRESTSHLRIDPRPRLAAAVVTVEDDVATIDNVGVLLLLAQVMRGRPAQLPRPTDHTDGWQLVTS